MLENKNIKSIKIVRQSNKSYNDSDIYQNELEKSNNKQGAEYVNGKVKILRPVTLSDGTTFQRNYWVALDQVKSTDKIIEGAAEGESQQEHSQFNSVQKLYYGTLENKINLNTNYISVIENGKNFIQKICAENNIESLKENPNVNFTENIKKIAFVQQQIQLIEKELNNPAIEQLQLLKKEMQEQLNVFIYNSKIVNIIEPLLKKALLSKNNQNKSSARYTINLYLPEWLEVNLDMRRNNAIEYGFEYNFNTKKMNFKEENVRNSYINQSIGYKIEQTNAIINKILDSFYQDRIKIESLKGYKQDNNIPNNNIVTNSKNIYPNIEYKNEKSAGLSSIDPHILDINDNETTNILALGLDLFFNSSMFKKLLMLDLDYACLILGILISQEG